MIETILWIIVAILFMVATFFFGALVYFTIQHYRIIGLKKEIQSISDLLSVIEKQLTGIIRKTKDVKLK